MSEADGDRRFFFEQIDARDIISFDVFDTLITRAIAQPVDVFAIVEALLLSSHWALAEPNAIDGFAIRRVAAERRARERRFEDRGHSEVGIDDIYAVYAEFSGASAALVAALQQTEVAQEFRLVRAVPEAVALFAYARAQNKRVILCSDMYLSSKTIGALVKACGYSDYEALFVSAEIGASKHAGGLFTAVAKQLAVSPDRCVHIGDNPHGDALMARRSGWSAAPLIRAPIPQPARSPWPGEPAFAQRIVAAAIAGLARVRAERCAAADTDEYETVGYQIFGPLITGFLLWLRVAIERRSPDRIALIARDGYLLHSVLPKFLATLPDPPPCDYVYASRGSLLLPGMTDFSLARLQHLYAGRRTRSVAEHLRRLELDPHRATTQILAAGFSGPEEHVKNGDPRMKALLASLAADVLRESARQRPLVTEYLAPFFAAAREVMLVDVGWTGNIQASIARLVHAIRPEVIIRGRYVGLFPDAAVNTLPRHTMHGWLQDIAPLDEFERDLWWGGGVELLESVMTAPHGTTLGYERSAGGFVRPVLEPAAGPEAAAGAHLDGVQRGTLAFIDDFLEAYGDVPAESLNTRAWAADFYRLVTDPTRREAELLGSVMHSDTVGATSACAALAPLAAGGDDGPGSDQIFWKSGFIVRNGLDESAAFDEFIYLMLHDDIRVAVARRDVPSGYDHYEQHGRREGRLGSGAAYMNRQRARTRA